MVSTINIIFNWNATEMQYLYLIQGFLKGFDAGHETNPGRVRKCVKRLQRSVIHWHNQADDKKLGIAKNNCGCITSSELATLVDASPLKNHTSKDRGRVKEKCTILKHKIWCCSIWHLIKTNLCLSIHPLLYLRKERRGFPIGVS